MQKCAKFACADTLILLHLGGKYSTENGKIASYILYQLIVTALN